MNRDIIEIQVAMKRAGYHSAAYEFPQRALYYNNFHMSQLKRAWGV